MSDGRGRLHQVAQHVDDLDRAVAFYRDTLGLPLVATFDPPGLAFFDLGGTRLLLEMGAPSALLYLRSTDRLLRSPVRRLREVGERVRVVVSARVGARGLVR